jgi:hypothetical protein
MVSALMQWNFLSDARPKCASHLLHWLDKDFTTLIATWKKYGKEALQTFGGTCVKM